MDGTRRSDLMSVKEHVALASAPRLPPEKQWWNLQAKIHKARQIAGEELQTSIANAREAGLPDAHNNSYDALRHARWSQRMADEIGPVFARVAGLEHELEGSLLHGQGMDEALMDLRNNAEGRRAGAEHRPIDPRNLQSGPSQRAPTGNPTYSAPASR